MGIRQLMEPDSLEEDAEKMIFPSSFMRKRDGKIKGGDTKNHAGIAFEEESVFRGRVSALVD